MKLFGTDGIREIFGQGIFEGSNIIRLANAIDYAFKDKKSIVIAHDPRESYINIIESFLRGFRSNVSIFSVDICPTGVMPLIIKEGGFDLGIVITASHNPANYNGFKFFNKSGQKITKSEQQKIEEEYFKLPAPLKQRKKPLRYWIEIFDQVIESLQKKYPIKIDKKIIFDCANGAAAAIVLPFFKKTEIDIKIINTFGEINKSCGSLYPQALIEKIQEESADLGFSFDGDGDRVIIIDSQGRIYDGDDILYILATNLRISSVATTVLANLGLIQALKDQNIKCIRTKVGDHNVIEAMQKENLLLGAEPSGHIITMEDNIYSGDGFITALKILTILEQTGKKLNELTFPFKYPQISFNLDVQEKKDLSLFPEIIEFQKNLSNELGSEGRFILRYSETEYKLRLMLEGKELKKINQLGEQFITILRRNLK